MGLLRGSVRFVGFIKLAILARILTPSEFGIFGIAALMLAFLEVMTETGINVFLVQEEGKLEEYISTSWLVSIIRGFLISILLISFSPIIALFFKSPDARHILMLISIVPFLRGFINPAIVKFQKKLQFHKEFLFRISIYSFDAIVAVILAFITQKAESLVWGLTAGVLLEIILSFMIIKPRPTFNFELHKIKKVINRGKWMTFAGIFNYLFYNGDDMVVGRLLNTGSLGLYQVAYKIATLPIFEISEVIGKVTFPIYVKITNDRIRIWQAFKKVTIFTSLIVIPFGIIMVAFTKPIVLILLGENWVAAVPVMKVLAVFGTFRALIAPSPAVLLAVKKQEYVMVITLVSILGMGITIIPLVLKFGIVGAAYSAIIGSVVSLPVIVYYLRKVLRS